MFHLRIVGSQEIVIRDRDGACVPNDPANTDYQRYLEWVAAGGVPEPWPTS